MLNKAYRMGRRSLGFFRIAAIVVGFGCIIHFAHRECARNAEGPIRMNIIKSLSSAKSTKSERSWQDFHATAYCVTGMMRTGIPAAPGYVSADPKVIPLGSMIYVESPLMSGIYQVMDTGEKIKGKIIDIFIPSYETCVDFGRRVVKVKVLRYGFHGNPPPKKASK